MADRKYFQFPLSQEEEEFPLAYSIVVHHKVFSNVFMFILNTIFFSGVDIFSILLCENIRIQYIQLPRGAVVFSSCLRQSSILDKQLIGHR